MSKAFLGGSMALVISLVVLGGAKAPEQSGVSREVAANSDFPFVIEFEQGAQQFNAGDEIKIDEVRSTSEDMQSGICRISGTYNLASEKEATLAASVTATQGDGKGPWNSAQTLLVTKGSGTFTLMLPISVKGWPHVSFYDKSSSFGGIYIGTGESVMRKWFGSN